jgi:hypothetical protein
MRRIRRTWLVAALAALAVAPAAQAQSDTDAVLGLINGGGSQISGAVDRALAGEELTDEQVSKLQQMIDRAAALDVTAGIWDVLHQIDVDVRNSEERLTYGYEQVDSSGQRWRYSADSGGWVKVDENPLTGSDVYTPGADVPRFQLGPSSGSIYHSMRQY